jgi:hypothetical protein
MYAQYSGLHPASPYGYGQSGTCVRPNFRRRAYKLHYFGDQVLTFALVESFQHAALIDKLVGCHIGRSFQKSLILKYNFPVCF